MRIFSLLLLVVLAGCDLSSGIPNTNDTLVEAKQGFKTKIIKSGDSFGPAVRPNGNEFDLIKYQSPVGEMAAYLTKDPGDGKKHPAIVWITGGDNNSISDVWSPNPRSNDQSASAFRKAGVVMMFPSQRGGNDNPGSREGFLGEVADVLAATDHLTNQPYVDPDQIYLGGHSTGGTLAMLVGESTDRYRAIFSLGPVASVGQYGGDYVYCDPNDLDESFVRSPICWLKCVTSPMYVFEGAVDGNWDAVEMMKSQNTNPKIQFFKVPNKNHFSVIAPLAEMLAAQVVAGEVKVTEESVKNLK